MVNPPDDVASDVLAVHEAGHLLVNVALSRGFDFVSLDLVSGKRGVFNSPATEAFLDFHEYLLLLAGPRAQYEIRKDSIPEGVRDALAERIVDFQGPRIIPKLYDYTGWQGDVTPIYEALCMPDASASVEQGARLTRRIHSVDVADKVIKAFFSDGAIIRDCCAIARLLEQKRYFTCAEVSPWLNELPSIKSGLATSLLRWRVIDCEANSAMT
jgi:hypothetical protein